MIWSRSREARVDPMRGGFSLIEVLVAMAIVGILAGIAIPNMRTVTDRARAAALFGDVSTVRQATLDYNASQNAWPADASSGTIPPGLGAFLPDGFSFSGEGYELDFENVTLPSGLPYDPSVTRMVGMSITVSDPGFSNAVVEALGATIVYSIGNTHTVVFDAA